MVFTRPKDSYCRDRLAADYSSVSKSKYGITLKCDFPKGLRHNQNSLYVFSVVSIQRRDALDGAPLKSELVEEFHVQFSDKSGPRVLIPLNGPIPTANDGRHEAEPVPGQRASRRASHGINYAEMEGIEGLICWEYAGSLECLLIMHVTEHELNFYFYDNHSWNLVSKIRGFIVETTNLQTGIYSLSVSPALIVVRQNRSEADQRAKEIYLIPIAFEDLEELEDEDLDEVDDVDEEDIDEVDELDEDEFYEVDEDYDTE